MKKELVFFAFVDDLIVCSISENFCDWFQAEVSKKSKIIDYSDLT